MVKSGQKLLLLMIITVSLKASLPVYAKSLRVARESALVRGLRSTVDQSMNVDVDSSSCLPTKNQTDYYNGLNVNGNALYYALKAVEIDKNRTGAAIISEDNTFIESIEQSRFSPAGMDRANKVVCAKLLQEMDAETSLFSSTALCAWDYICDYKADRFPNYLFKARCKTARCNGDCNKDNNKRNMCRSHGIHVTVLQMRGSCGEWVWGQELLPIACTCTSDIGMIRS